MTDAQKLLLQYYEDVTKPTEIAHDRLLDENTELKRKIKNLEENVVRYRDIASRLRKEKVMLLDTIERLNVKKS